MTVFSAPSPKQLLLLRVALHVASLLPLTWMLSGFIAGSSGNSPVRVLLWSSGDWSLYMLCITLTVTPLRCLSGWNWLSGFRRLPGMYAFFYGVLHFGAYLWLRRSEDLGQIFGRIVSSPLLLTGFIALAIMLPLAATSTWRVFQMMGKTAWQWLHRLTYLGAVLVVAHYWLVKARMHDTTQPTLIAVIVAVLLLFRLGWFLAHRSKR
ncbi:MAG: protein-methionine-sulfoxide reductase heme-binding subunit MsrQ [Burkholderiaceae bacterium]|nr:protein-methionine-sulfoxide reductase heme-binding subunit MsrQ [Burkholderiaceae bacterium]